MFCSSLSVPLRWRPKEVSERGSEARLGWNPARKQLPSLLLALPPSSLSFPHPVRLKGEELQPARSVRFWVDHSDFQEKLGFLPLLGFQEISRAKIAKIGSTSFFPAQNLKKATGTDRRARRAARTEKESVREREKSHGVCCPTLVGFHAHSQRRREGDADNTSWREDTSHRSIAFFHF